MSGGVLGRVAATTSVKGEPVLTETSASENRVRVAILGAGQAGLMHARAFAELGPRSR